MRFYAAELKKELDRTAVEGSYCEVEAYQDGTTVPKIEVRSSSANIDKTTLYCMGEIAEYCNANELNFYVTVTQRFEGLYCPIVIIF